MPGLPLKNPWTRPIPNPSQDLPNLFACVSALKETVESLIGQRGRSPNRAVTFNDLTAMGILTQEAVASPGGSFAAGTYQAGSGIAIDNRTAPPTISTAVPYLPLTGGTVTGTIFNNNSAASTGAFHMAPNAAGTFYGSFWYNDGFATYLLLTNNNDAFGAYNGLRPFQVNDATGAVAMGHGLNLSAGALQLAFVDFATQDGTFHHLRDKSGRAAILMGGAADSENYYWNVTHRFQGVAGATYDYYIDAGGITIQNGASAYRSRKTDGTQVALAYIDGFNNVIIGGYGSGLNCFVGSGGSYFSTDGNLFAGQHIILKNGWSVYATNAAGNGNYPVIGVASDNRIKINSSVAYGVDAYGNWTFASISASDVTVLGASAIVVFADRAAATSGPWGWYADGGVARLWNFGGGDRMTIDTGGSIKMAGAYFYGVNATGAVNSTGGPFLYFDSNYIMAHLGTGNLGFLVQNTAGNSVGGFASDGWLLSLSGRRVAYNDGNYTQIRDGSDRTAIQLGSTADPQNYYRNTIHNFQGIAGAGYQISMSSAGITVQNRLGFRGLNTDNATAVNLAYVWTDNSVRIGTDGNTTCYIGNGGSYFTSDGTFWPVSNIALRNNMYLFGFEVTNTGVYQLIGLGSDNRVKINPSNLNVDAGGPWYHSGNLFLLNGNFLHGRHSNGSDIRLCGVVDRNYFGNGVLDTYISAAGWCYFAGHPVAAADNTYVCGYPGSAWNGVFSYAYPGSSDVRLKHEIEDLPDDCLDLVRAITPRRYKFHNAPEQDRDRKRWGFIAQEVAEAMAARGHDFGGHFIGDDPAQSQALDHSDLLAVLWHATKKLAARVAALETKS